MLFSKTSLHASEVTSTGRTSSTEAEWSFEHQVQGESKEQYHLRNLRHKGFSSIIPKDLLPHLHSIHYCQTQDRCGHKLLKEFKKFYSILHMDTEQI